MTFPFTMKNDRARKTILLFLVLLSVTFSFQCIKAPLEPKPPQWSIPLNIQLIDRKWTFGDMISKDPKFIIDSTSSRIVYQPASVVNSPTAITLPELNPLQSAVGNKLGLIELDVAPISGINVAASQMFPSSVFGIPYPASSFSLPMQQAVSNSGALYDYVVFENGRMTLTITNNFAFTVKFASPGVQLINTDMLANPTPNPTPSDSVVATFTFPGGVGPGATASSTAPLSGKTMSANLILRFTVQSDDIQGKIITSTDKLTAGMTVDGGTTGTKASLSKARIQLDKPVDVKNLPDSAVQIVDDSTKIKRAEFKDGKFTVKITNNIPTRIAVEFKLKEFVDRISGVAFKLRDDVTGIDTIPASGILLQTVYLKDYALQSQDTVRIGGRLDTLSVPNVHFSLKIKTLAATTRRVDITKDDSVQVQIQPQDNNQTPPRKTYVLEKVIGKVKPTPVPINETVDAAIGDIGNNFVADSIKFDSVSITLKILSTGSFPTDLKMRIIGLDKNGARRDSMTAQELKGGALTDTLRMYPGLEKKIVFDKTTSRIDAFLSSFFAGGNGNLPQKFIVTGEAVVDPKSYYQYPESTGTVKVGDSVYTSVDFLFPVRIGIMNGTFRDTISIGDTSGNKIDKESLTSIDSGKVIFTIFNAFPFKLGVSTKLFPALAADPSKPDTANVLFLLPKTSEIQADSARYGVFPNDPDRARGLTGTVVGLTTDDVDKINPANFIAVNIKLQTSGNGDHPVPFNKDYYVHLKAFVSVRYNVNFDKFK